MVEAYDKINEIANDLAQVKFDADYYFDIFPFIRNPEDNTTQLLVEIFNKAVVE